MYVGTHPRPARTPRISSLLLLGHDASSSTKAGGGEAAEPSSSHPFLAHLGAHVPSLAPAAGAMEGRRLAGG